MPMISIIPINGILSNLFLIANMPTMARTVRIRVRILKLLKSMFKVSKGLSNDP